MRLDFETILGIIFFVVFFILPAFNRKKKAPSDDTATPTAPTGSKTAPGQPAASGAPTATPARSAQRQQVPTGRSATPYTIESSTSGQAGGTSGSGGNAPPVASSVDGVLEEIRARIREAQRQENTQRTGTGQRGSAPARGGQQNRAQPARSQQQTPTQRTGSGSLVSSQPTTVGGSSTSGSLVSSPARGIGSTGSAAPQQVIGREGPPPRAREQVSAPLEVTRARRGQALEDGKALRDLRARKTKAVRQGIDTPGSRGRLLATDGNALMTGMIWHEVLSEPAARRRRRRTR